MIKINLLKDRGKKQKFFDFKGIDIEKAYKDLNRACKKDRLYALEDALEERAQHSDSIHAETGMDLEYTDNAWHELIYAHQQLKEIPRLKQQIKNTEETWKKIISTPIKTYEEHVSEKFSQKEAWLRLAEPEILHELNTAVTEYNSLTPEQKEKAWLNYYVKTDQIIYQDIPQFIKTRGCINCTVSKDMQEKTGKPYGFDHEIISGCLIQGCTKYGHDLLNPFIDPEEAMKKARETGNQNAIENARKYVLSVKEKYESTFKKTGISLDKIITGQTCQPKEQT